MRPAGPRRTPSKEGQTPDARQRASRLVPIRRGLPARPAGTARLWRIAATCVPPRTWHGISVALKIHPRRFFCDDLSCKRKIFCERLPEILHGQVRPVVRFGGSAQERASRSTRRASSAASRPCGTARSSATSDSQPGRACAGALTLGRRREPRPKTSLERRWTSRDRAARDQAGDPGLPRGQLPRHGQVSGQTGRPLKSVFGPWWAVIWALVLFSPIPGVYGELGGGLSGLRERLGRDDPI